MATNSKPRKPRSPRTGGLIKKLRKPLAPPTRVAGDERKYLRARERERIQRGDKT
ncbi:MAG: hypothetical protein IVW56_05625 [Candidatus Binataceae bacterium]|nr:hypothetical protein [Candidatus Binataceae bacterium]